MNDGTIRFTGGEVTFGLSPEIHAKLDAIVFNDGATSDELLRQILAGEPFDLANYPNLGVNGLGYTLERLFQKTIGTTWRGGETGEELPPQYREAYTKIADRIEEILQGEAQEAYANAILQVVASVQPETTAREVIAWAEHEFVNPLDVAGLLAGELATEVRQLLGFGEKVDWRQGF
jgi:hypothetical protein